MRAGARWRKAQFLEHSSLPKGETWSGAENSPNGPGACLFAWRLARSAQSEREHRRFLPRSSIAPGTRTRPPTPTPWGWARRPRFGEGRSAEEGARGPTRLVRGADGGAAGMGPFMLMLGDISPLSRFCFFLCALQRSGETWPGAWGGPDETHAAFLAGAAANTAVARREEDSISNPGRPPSPLLVVPCLAHATAGATHARICLAVNHRARGSGPHMDVDATRSSQSDARIRASLVARGSCGRRGPWIHACSE